MSPKSEEKVAVRRLRAWATILGALALAPEAAPGQIIRTGTTTVTATVSAEASIAVNATTTLTQAGGGFVPYSGSTTVTFSVRTTKVGGSGSIVLQPAEFAPAGGPTVAGGNLTYTCGGAPSVGSICAGSQTANVAASTPVVSAIGANAKTASTTALVNWVVADSPTYDTGTYTSAVVFTLTSL